MKTALIIDDNHLVRDSLARVLRRHFRVTACGTVEEALALCVGARRFDVLLCDMLLGDGTGQEFYERLRARCVDQSDRILFLTGHDGDAREGTFYEATRGRHLFKPISAVVLIANLEMMAGDGAPLAA